MRTFDEMTPATGFGLPEFTVTCDSTALMIIDMQYIDAHRDFGVGARAQTAGNADQLDPYFTRLETVVVPNISDLIARCRVGQLPVIHVRVCNLAADHSDTSWRYKQFGMTATPSDIDAQFLPELAPVEGEVIVNKTTSSVFNSTNIDFILKNMGIDTLIMTGVVTNGCVESSTRGAGDRGYKVLLVEDCTAAMTEEGHTAALANLHRNFALVRTHDEIVGQIDVVTSPVAVPV